jgi:hypothetical protein
MAVRGPVSQAMLAIARGIGDDRVLARSICLACVEGLDVDGAALSLLTTTVARHTAHATDLTAQLLEELQFPPTVIDLTKHLTMDMRRPDQEIRESPVGSTASGDNRCISGDTQTIPAQTNGALDQLDTGYGAGRADDKHPQGGGEQKVLRVTMRQMHRSPPVWVVDGSQPSSTSSETGQAAGHRAPERGAR